MSKRWVVGVWPFSKSNRKSRLLEIIHADVCGPMRVESKRRKRYFVTFIDDFSKWCEVYFLHTKDEVLDVFKKYKAFAEKHTGKEILFLQSDNGREFVSKEFDDFLSQHGIRRRLIRRGKIALQLKWRAACAYSRDYRSPSGQMRYRRPISQEIAV